MLQETPVYDRLVAERGDIPAQVRSEADRLQRQLGQVLRLRPAARLDAPPPAPGPPAPHTAS
ncbi:hypothetical protein [Streptomyces tauricus]|uniref:hypothetical protein n=1 Tax=Streptomyces tauricus TaxID=68274 RepID=UPI003414CC1C